MTLHILIRSPLEWLYRLILRENVTSQFMGDPITIASLSLPSLSPSLFFLLSLCFPSIKSYQYLMHKETQGDVTATDMLGAQSKSRFRWLWTWGFGCIRLLLSTLRPANKTKTGYERSGEVVSDQFVCASWAGRLHLGHTLDSQVVLRDTPPPLNKENGCSSSPTWFLPRWFLAVAAFSESIKGIGEGIWWLSFYTQALCSQNVFHWNRFWNPYFPEEMRARIG